MGVEAVWLLDESAGTVWRVDPRTLEVLEPIPLSNGLDRIAIGEGFAWVLDTALGTLTPIAEDGLGVRPAIDVGTDATDVVVGLGSVWVASGGTVVEINPATFQVVRTIEVGDTPILRLAVDEGADSLWLDLASAR